MDNRLAEAQTQKGFEGQAVVDLVFCLMVRGGAKPFLPYQRLFIGKNAAALGMHLRWKGKGVDEVDYWNNYPIVKIDPRYFRPSEGETLLGDPNNAKEKLGWVPEITFNEMVREMVAADLANAKKHALLKQHGYQITVSVEQPQK